MLETVEDPLQLSTVKYTVDGRTYSTLENEYSLLFSLPLSLLYSSLHIVALYLIVYLQPLFPPNQKEGDAARAPSDAASCAVLLQRRPHSGRRPRPELLLLLCIQRARAEGTNTIRDSRPLWSYVCLIGLTL